MNPPDTSLLETRPASELTAASFLPNTSAPASESGAATFTGWADRQVSPAVAEALADKSTLPERGQSHGAAEKANRPFVLPDVEGPMHVDRLVAAGKKEKIVLDYCKLKEENPALSLREAGNLLATSAPSLCRWIRAYDTEGIKGLMDELHKCGTGSRFPAVTEEESLALMDIYRKSNKGKDAASMRSAAEAYAMQTGVRDELRSAILAVTEKARVPLALKRIFERVTKTHIAMDRRPKHTASTGFSGNVGSHVDDMADRLRIIESDDGTFNFAAWIPWAMGGDPCSDRFHVRLGRWQFLPAVDAGWTRMYLCFAIVCRPRGSYSRHDIRALIYMLCRSYGLPDAFRFERGPWESDDVVRLIRALLGETGLQTVHSPDQKAIIEGGFSLLWEYLSQIDGQVGRYRGDVEAGNILVQKCRAGRADPRDHFPSLAQCTNAVTAALARANARTVDSIYGKFIPEERHELLKAQRPWRPLPADMEYKFAPFVREWTVCKGTVGGDIPILEDYSAPFYFAHEDLWRWNGHKVRLYFDITATPCLAAVESTENYNGYRADEIICRAELLGGLPHFCRGQLGLADEQCERQVKWRSAALSALRMDLRALGPRGQVTAAVSEERNGSGSFARVETGLANTQPPISHAAPHAEKTLPARRGGWRLQQMEEHDQEQQTQRPD
jgi:hypothetical protein